MNGGFYIGAVGLDAQQRALDVIANNIANINTTAFKRSGIQFSELLGADDPLVTGFGAPAFAGVTVSGTPQVWTEGALRQTSSPLDIAIDGDGLLEVLGPAGRPLLWRGGTLKINDDGFLATADGLQLKQMISVPRAASGLTIGADGIVSAVSDGNVERLGQLDLVLMKDVSTLSPSGNGYYAVSDESETMAVQPGEEGGGTLVQGSLEAANVQLTDEMTSLLLVQRAYAANAQVVQTADQLMAIVNGLRR